MGRAPLVLPLIALLGACNVILGNEEPVLRAPVDGGAVDPPASGRPELASPEAGAADGPPTACGAPDDPENCGACGRSCGGGACAGGRCGPVALVPENADFNGMYGIAVDDTHVFFSNYCKAIGRVFRVPRAGGAFTAISAPGAAYDCGSELLLDGDAVYFVNHWGKGIWKAKKSGGTSAPILSGLPHNPQLIARSTTHLFFAQSWDHGLHRVAKDGTGLVGLAAGRILGLAVDASRVYYAVEAGTAPCLPGVEGASGGCLWQSEHDGSSASVIAAGGQPIDVTVDDDHVYWADTKAKRIFRRAKSGGAPVPLTPTLDDAPGLPVVDATHVYFAVGAYQIGSIGRVPKTGGVPEELVGPLTFISRLTVDDESLFFTTGTDGKGAVYKLVK